jgi:hypothetical protein
VKQLTDFHEIKCGMNIKPPSESPTSAGCANLGIGILRGNSSSKRMQLLKETVFVKCKTRIWHPRET